MDKAITSHHVTSIGRREIQRRHHTQCTHTCVCVWVDVSSSQGTPTQMTKAHTPTPHSNSSRTMQQNIPTQQQATKIRHRCRTVPHEQGHTQGTH
mmetsp:Transcript_18013/g.51222  ORF Transcript_18013/g.51222 Transcript_18013/m.51222 type:complete len:95 (+) Transcript_18013:727-1011(+)